MSGRGLEMSHLDAINKTIVFYDGGCSLCSKEIDHYRRCDRNMLIDWIDIQTDTNLLQQLGIHYTDAMRELHVLRWDGVVVRGAAAFASIWSKLPRYSLVGKLLYRFHMVPLANWFYRKFAQWRIKKRCFQN